MNFDENNRISYWEKVENGEKRAIVICSFDGKDKEREFVRVLTITLCLNRKYQDFMIMVQSGDEFGNYSYKDGDIDKVGSIPVKSYEGLNPDGNDYLDEYTTINNANILGTKGYDLESSPSESSKAETSKTENSSNAEKVIYDKNNVKIVYKGISEGSYDKYINLYIENNSSKNFTVQVRDFSINGYMIDPVFSPNIAAGKKINDDISIHKSKFEKNDIDEIKDVELKFLILNSDDYSDNIETETIKFSV